MIDIKKLPDFEKERLKVIIYETEIYDATNRRNIVGKHWTEIQMDAEYFQNISKKAKEILNELKKYSS